jgi:putative tributyrin esterase
VPAPASGGKGAAGLSADGRRLVATIAVALAVAASVGGARERSPADAPRAVLVPAIETQRFVSAALGQERSFSVLLPIGYAADPRRRYPVLYLLHGKGGTHRDWAAKSRLAEHVGAVPLIVVMPDGGDGWYVDGASPGSGYETQIVGELIPHVDGRYRTIARREGRAIGGLSMGGYGAMKLALKRPDLFVAAASHSGALSFARETWDEARLVFGPSPGDRELRRDNDVFRLAMARREAGSGWNGPALYLDCGTEDFLYDANARFRAFLREIGVPYEYHEFPGGHTWDYWDARLPDELRFVLKHVTVVE